MNNHKQIPDIIISRLPVYLRALQYMQHKGKQNTSSQELGELLNISAAQIRKDLSQFGEFGKQGTGYNITFLLTKLREILKIDTVWDLAIVGMGDMGHALSRYTGFKDRGFRVAMMFDNDPAKIGTQVGEFTILGVIRDGGNHPDSGYQNRHVVRPRLCRPGNSRPAGAGRRESHPELCPHQFEHAHGCARAIPGPFHRVAAHVLLPGIKNHPAYAG